MIINGWHWTQWKQMYYSVTVTVNQIALCIILYVVFISNWILYYYRNQLVLMVFLFEKLDFSNCSTGLHSLTVLSNVINSKETTGI